ncbi:two-component sensor histidine kinase [Frankia sp. CcI49]|nr:histidine kinase [Frankia sp. R43]ONH50587.1 two-component sensor histidine kinase [Frankia sp. CcI49]
MRPFRTRRATRHVTTSARLRILGWQVLLVAVALAGSVLVSREVLLARVDERVDRGLARQVAELRRLATASVDPRTSQPFSNVRDLLQAHLERTIPGPNETMLALVDGAPFRRSAEEPVYRLDSDRQVVATFAADPQPRYGTIRTPAGEVRFATVPVQVAGAPERGVFAAAVFVDRERAEVGEVVRVLAIVGFAALALAGAGGWLVAGRVLAPVRELRRTAQVISDTDFSRRIPVAGRDEIAELARTFNGMLDRLEDAFATQRAFVDDAGHELRTPITIIRGHLELLSDDPAERTETVALVTDELDRMSRMVDDLLTLAKARRPDFLQVAEVDLTAFTDDLMSRVCALASRRWRLAGTCPGTAVMDRHRVTQAVVQLAQNAVQNTDTGDEVRLGSRPYADGVCFWVTDTGPGVVPGDRERIFERFARGQPGRGSSEGAGLGLAIVRAIAIAHGGDVRVLGEPGDGATFELTVPRQGPAGGARVGTARGRDLAREGD